MSNKQQYLAYVSFSSLNNKKEENKLFAIIGSSQEEIVQKASKYGADATISSTLYPLSKDW